MRIVHAAQALRAVTTREIVKFVQRPSGRSSDAQSTRLTRFGHSAPLFVAAHVTNDLLCLV